MSKTLLYALAGIGAVIVIGYILSAVLGALAYALILAPIAVLISGGAYLAYRALARR